MPRRVVDGVASETLRRDLWCLAAASLQTAGILADVAELLADRGRIVALLVGAGTGGTEPDDTGQLGERVAQAPACRSVAEACARYGRTAADAVLVCTDPVADPTAFPPEGARVLVIGPRVRPVRGILAVPSAGDLRELFDHRARYRAASTYHEV